jgi:hypothetical protein
VNVLDRLIEKKTTIAGEVTISLAGIELVVLHLLASLEPVAAEEDGKDRSQIRGDPTDSRKSGKK